MKSIVIENGYGIDNIKVKEQAMPLIKGNEVLVKVQAISLNQLDLMIAKGALGTQLPHTLGSDAVGEVIEIGSEVTAFNLGDIVSTHYIQAWQAGALKPGYLKSRLGAEMAGVFSEYIAIPESYLVHKPYNLTAREGSAIPLAGVTAWEAIVNAGQLKAGQTVLLQGTGGVSIFALQFAKALGAKVILLSSSDEKLERAKALGADEIINYKTNTEWAHAVLAVTDGRGVDLAVEMSWTTIGETAKAMRFGGRIAVVGMLGGVSTELSVLDVMLKSLTVIGVQAGSKVSFEEMNKAIEINNIKPVIDKVFNLSELGTAVAYFNKGQHFGKVVLEF